MTRFSPRDSHGTGAPSAIGRAHGLRLGMGALVLSALALSGCSPDFKDGVGPRVAVPNVSGRVERDGMGASALDVSVGNPIDDVSIASTRTDANGNYAIAVPSGTWEVKVKGLLSGDFDSVTRNLVVDGSTPGGALRPLDVDAYGAALETPLDTDTLAMPRASKPATFAWRAPQRAFSTERAQLYDSAGSAVWYSSKGVDTTATWDGVGNQGTFVGVVMPAATYTWRVKFDLPDSSVARTRSRRVTLQ